MTQKANIQKSIALLQKYKRFVKPKMCYSNSFLIASLNRSKGFCYVEGFATMPEFGIPTPHAWIEYNGEVLDATWALIHAENITDSKYFAAMKWQENLPILSDELIFPFLHWSEPEYNETSKKIYATIGI